MCIPSLYSYSRCIWILCVSRSQRDRISRGIGSSVHQSHGQEVHFGESGGPHWWGSREQRAAGKPLLSFWRRKPRTHVCEYSEYVEMYLILFLSVEVSFHFLKSSSYGFRPKKKLKKSDCWLVSTCVNSSFEFKIWIYIFLLSRLWSTDAVQAVRVW